MAAEIADAEMATEAAETEVAVEAVLRSSSW